MDPKACLDACTQALFLGDFATARERLNEYREWRERGGFEPPEVAGGIFKAYVRGDVYADYCAQRLRRGGGEPQVGDIAVLKSNGAQFAIQRISEDSILIKGKVHTDELSLRDFAIRYGWRRPAERAEDPTALLLCARKVAGGTITLMDDGEGLWSVNIYKGAPSEEHGKYGEWKSGRSFSVHDLAIQYFRECVK